MHKISLPYNADSALLFQRIRHLPYPALLDSGNQADLKGQFDILCAAPVCRVVADQGKCWKLDSQGQQTEIDSPPFQALKKVLLEYGFLERCQEHPRIPFMGGALGYFSYDLGRYLETLPEISEDDIPLAQMQMGIYLWAIVVDHEQQSCNLIYTGDDQHTQMQALARHISITPASPEELPQSFKLLKPFQSNLDKEGYQQRFDRIINYIRSGDCYQVNLAQRFSASYSGDSWQAYQLLRKAAPTPFSTYLEVDGGELLSLSPERFIQVADSQVETKPIKGTRPRGDNPDMDRQLKEALSASIKDRAENLMIVDLLRNDLGRTCTTGSVSVPKLFAVESYANVHHLVSTINGRLDSADKCLELLEGCFPGGSITGAPKIRAMEIIEELEPHRRSAYCGSIGYIGFDGRVDTSIAIRTLVASNQTLHCWAGGGIVADSQCQAEYQETFDKVSNLITPLEKAFLQN
ncbi:MAG: aminodeoxychorismate synthase component I [Motiliproteus sp.]|nr:aminodeoxychorismate synthase component I [Motiliproteus sp.]MCW9051814.1 aminodeoxychorismate synthase component I [Motiliproteus sp.]